MGPAGAGDGTGQERMLCLLVPLLDDAPSAERHHETPQLSCGTPGWELPWGGRGKAG